MSKKDPRLERVWAPLATIVSSATVAITVPLAVLTLINDQTAARIQASLRYIERFDQGHLLEARNVLFDTWKNEDIRSFPELTIAAHTALVERVLSEYEATNSDMSPRTALINIASFFDGAEICVSSKVCDEAVMLAALGGYGQRFYCLYGIVLADEVDKLQMEGLSGGLKALSERVGPC